MILRPATDNVAEFVRKKLQLLRELDSTIDFSRSNQQLEVVIFIGASARPVSTDEIVENLGLDRKQALDALRKLKFKEIVVDKGSLYELTEKRRKFYQGLADDLDQHAGDRCKSSAQRASGNMAAILLLVEILRILYTMGGSASLEKISKIVRRNPREVLEHLGPFIRGPEGRGLLEISMCERGLLRKRVLRCIGISGEGRLLISRAPEIVRYVYLEKILRKILGTGDLEEVSERILLIAVGAFSASLYLRSTGVGDMALVASFTVLVFLASLYIVSRRIFTRLVLGGNGLEAS